MMLLPEIKNHFPFVHQSQSVGRGCQNHFIKTDFETPFWPSRKECHSLLAMSSMGSDSMVHILIISVLKNEC